MTCDKCNKYNLLDKNSGECRAIPPKVFPVPVHTISGQQIGFQPVFPRVSNDCWCGWFVKSIRSGESGPEQVNKIALV